MTSPRLLIASLLGLVLLAACAPMRPTITGPEPVFRSPLTADADAALALGDLSSALTLLRMAANDAPANAAMGLRLEAAFFAYQLNDSAAAQRVISAAERSPSPRNRASAELLRIVMATEATPARTIEALQALEGLLPDRLKPYRHQALGNARSANGEALAAVNQLLKAERLHAGTSARLANEAALWRALMRMPFAQVEAALENDPSARMQQWLTLAHGVQQRLLDPAATSTFLSTVPTTTMVHPALLSTRILASQRAALSPARRVAVLLPLSGDLARAGQNIQRGILAALYANQQNMSPPQVHFIDVGADGLSPSAAYQRAIADGAGEVIGPLSKAAVRELLNNTRISTPAIVLNRVDDAPRRRDAYQFGLAPEDDAEAAARLAYQRGHRRLVTLSSTSDWGKRVSARFAQQFEALGGEILEHSTYAQDQEDMRVPIRALFNLDASTARFERLKDITNQRFSFEPRRRRDMDAAFVAAFHEPARLVVPQMRFHRGIDLPIFATSASYPPGINTVANEDLEGVMMPAMPWLTNTTSDQLSVSARSLLIKADALAPNAQLSELLALGIDSYRLLGSLTLLEQHRHLRLDAATGELYVDETGHVKRDLNAARVTQQGLQRMGEITTTQ